MKISKKRSLQRILTAVLSIAMIFTSLPVDMLAGVFGGVGKVRAAGDIHELTVEALNLSADLDGKASSATVYDIFEIGTSVKTKDDNSSYSDSKSFTKRFSTGANSDTLNTNKSIKFVIGEGKTASVKIYAQPSGSDGDGAMAALVKADNTVIKSENVTAKTVVTIDNVEAGTYYVTGRKDSLGTAKGLDVACIIVTETSISDDSDDQDASANGTIKWQWSTQSPTYLDNEMVWKNGSEVTKDTNNQKVIQSGTGEASANVITPDEGSTIGADLYKLKIDATTGAVKVRSANAGSNAWTQFNTGAKISVPLGIGNNTITVTPYTASAITIDGENIDGANQAAYTYTIVNDTKGATSDIVAVADTYVGDIELTIEEAPVEVTQYGTVTWTPDMLDNKNGTKIEGTSDTLVSTSFTADEGSEFGDYIKTLVVDATSGKLAKNSSELFQINNGTVVKVPLVAGKNTVSFELSRNGSPNITVDGTAYTAATTIKVEKICTENDFLEISSNANGYIGAITLKVKSSDDSEDPDEDPIEEYENTADGIRDISVWDFGAEQFQDDDNAKIKYTNRLTADIINNNFYPGKDATAGASGVNLPSFKYTDSTGATIAFADGGKDSTHRLRTDKTDITRYDGSTKKDADGNVLHGYVYSNMGSNPEVYIQVSASKYDILNYWVASNGGAETYAFENPSGGKLQNGQYTAGNGSSVAEKLTFIALEDGLQKIYGTNEKLVVARIIRETPDFVTLSGNVTGFGDNMPAGTKLVFTPEYDGVSDSTLELPAIKSVINADGSYSVTLPEQYTYNVTLEGADEYVVAQAGTYVSAGGRTEFTLAAGEGNKTGFNVTVKALDLVKVSGSLKAYESDGTTAIADGTLDAYVKSNTGNVLFAKPADKIYVPKLTLDGSAFSVTLEKGVEYGLSAEKMDDFTLVTEKFSATADMTDGVIELKKVPTNNVNVVFTEYRKGYDYSNEASETVINDAVVTKLTFKKILVADDKFTEDGYTYEFTNAADVALREGQYQVSVTFGNSEYKQYLTKDAKVTANGATVYIPLQKDSPYAPDGLTSFETNAADSVWQGYTITLGDTTWKTGNNHGILSRAADMTIGVNLKRSADVKVTTCGYNAGKTARVTATSGTVNLGTVSQDTTAKGDKDNASVLWTISDVPAGELTLTFNNNVYVHSIAVSYKGADTDEDAVAYDSEITVGKGKDYATINDALDAVRAMGERTAEQRVTILIDPGTYDEMLRVDTPYVTLKNASAAPSIAFKNAGVDVDADAVRITSYYGVGYNYYSMDSNYLYNADVLAVNTHNGYYTTENPGGGGTGDMWNATVWVSADGFEADGIIFENSFNQYIPEKEVADTHVKQGGAKEGKVIREAMKAGDTAVQQKAYVERAAALAFSDKVNANLNNCAVISHQDALYGGTGAKIYFKESALYGGTDYIFGGMNAVFDHCDLILQVSNDKNDQAYITAVQSNATPAYLFYYCTVKNTDSSVMNEAYINGGSKPGFWGRAWNGSKDEVLFYNTLVENSKDKTVYSANIYKDDTTDTVFTGTPLIRGRGWVTGLADVSDSRFMEYGTVESIDGSASRKPPVSEKNLAKFTFEGKEIAVPLVITAEQLAVYMGYDVDSIMTDGAVDSAKLDKKVGEYFGFDLEPGEKPVLPTISFTKKPTLSGNTSAPAVGDTLSVNYSLGEENDANDASAIKWYRVKDGEETLIKEADASDKSYTIAAEDEGCTLKVVVTPFLADGTTGEAAEVTLDVVISAAGDDDDKKDDDEKKTDDEDKDPEVPAGFVSNIAKISVPNNNVLLVPGQKTSIVAAFTAAVADKTVDAKYVVWKSSNKNVVTVDNNGNIVAVGAGKAVITVTSLDNGVTVSFPVEVGAEDTLYAGSDITLQLKESKNIEVTYGGHVIYGAKFESSASKIVKVDKTTGRVTAKKLGSAVINVTYNGKTAIVRVTVEDAAAAAEAADASYNNTNKLAKKVIKAPTTVKLKIDAKGKKLQKNVKVSGKGVLKGGVVIDASVNDARIATVTKAGDNKYAVKAVNSGATYITWTVKNGNYIAKKVTKVIVDRAAVAGELKLSARDASGNLVDLNGKADASANDASGNAVDASVNHLLKGGEVFTLPVGAGLKLNAYLPEGITDKSVVKWKSNNSAVKITKQGYLVVVKASAKPAVITAKVGKVTATFTVNVSGGSFSFKKAGATLSVKPGKAKTVKLATNGTVTKCEVLGSPAGVTASAAGSKVVVTATKAGTYFVKAYDANGNSSIAEIFVPQK